MCTVSMIIDHYREVWASRDRLPQYPTVRPLPNTITPKEVEEFMDLLKKAKQYDKDNNQEDCELEEKIEDLKRIAKEKGVELEIFERK